MAVNDYEARLLMDRTGWSEADAASRVEALIVTRGAQGSIIWAGAEQMDIPVVKPAAILDPTGCGCLIAGLLHGISTDSRGAHGSAALLGSIKIAHRGTQNHQFTPTTLSGNSIRHWA